MGDEDKMSEATDVTVSYTHTGGQYEVLSPDLVGTNKDFSPQPREKIDIRGLEYILTEGGKNVTLEEAVVNLVTAMIPDVNCILTKRQLNLIEESSERIGAINTHLDSIGENIEKLKKHLDVQLKTLELIEAKIEY
jgi:hypothetical protein